MKPWRRFLQDKTQVITLAKTALLCSQSPAELAGIEDREIAFAFNVECADILNQWEMEREAERFAALAGQSVAGALGGPPQGNNRVERW